MIVKLATLTFVILSFSVQAYSPCEINFVKYINGEMPSDLKKNPGINMWDERFDTELFYKEFKNIPHEKQENYLIEISKLVHKDTLFNNNLTKILNKLLEKKVIDGKFIKRNFINKQFEHTNFVYSLAQNKVTAHLHVDPEKMEYIEKISAQFKLKNKFKSKYELILIQSRLDVEDLKYALKEGKMTLRQNKQDLEQFRKYIEFVDNSKPHNVRKALKDIEKIYDYSYKPLVSYNPLRKQYRQFLDQLYRIDKFTARRAKEVERGFKLQQRSGVVNEIDEVVQKEANGIKVHIKEKLRLQKKIEDEPLPHALKKRAAVQARHEANILRKLMNGCNSGHSPRLDSAKKKFSRFKFGLALSVIPTFYIYKNHDKMGTDPYYWEKLGHEMFMSLVFTYVGNKIFTNTTSSFLGKYLEGYVKFGVLSYVEAFSYEELFGDKSLIRYIQRLYKPDLPESEIEKELKKLQESDKFEEEVKKLLAYLDKMSKLNNTKNFLDKYFNFSAYSSLDDNFKITQEDLESEEARELMMELLAERIYLQNMGEWPFFQTGRKDTDRFAFYRVRNAAWDIEGLLLNLTIFEIMCREPFGKVGSWFAILSIIVGEKYLNGDWTYELRREAINQ